MKKKGIKKCRLQKAESNEPKNVTAENVENDRYTRYKDEKAPNNVESTL